MIFGAYVCRVVHLWWKKLYFVLTGCGSVVNNTLVSPGYPYNSYPPGMYCVYKVSIPHGKALKIYFEIFQLEIDSSCG